MRLIITAMRLASPPFSTNSVNMEWRIYTGRDPLDMGKTPKQQLLSEPNSMFIIHINYLSDRL